MNRIDRLMAILVYMQSKKLVKATEIAERFEMSLRTVYRDVRALEEAGVPVCGEAGKGYSIQQGYHLPPVMFTREEAVAMITAGKMTEKLTDASLNTHYTVAMEKVRAVIRSMDKDFLEEIESHILVLQPPSIAQQDFPNNYLATIQKALVHKNVLKIEYYSPYNNEVTARVVEPIGICFYSSRWHLISYCRLRNEYRDFRIDRLKSLLMTEESYDSKHPSVADYFPFNQDMAKLLEVVISFPMEMKLELAEQKYYFGFISEELKGNMIEMKFVATDLAYMGNWVLGFGNKAEIIAPEGLKDYVSKKVKELAIKYLKNKSRETP
jgi:predicted DNA-binding transcriptional regulator YafY